MRFTDTSGDHDDINVMLLQAAQVGEWAVVQDVSQRHHRLFDAPMVAAECKGVDFVRKHLHGCTVAEMVELTGAAFRGGALSVVQLLLDRHGVGINDRYGGGGRDGAGVPLPSEFY
jgi:hypothetical protein